MAINLTELEDRLDKFLEELTKEDILEFRYREYPPVLKAALLDPKWIDHEIGNKYNMDGIPGWKIAYYPIFANGKTGAEYEEPRALVEKPMKEGTDFREVPLRYISKIIP